MTQTNRHPRDFPMPAILVDSARAWLDGRRSEIVPARPSATVMLVRDGDSGVEVFMLRRGSGMPFAPNMMAFPGGGVDPRDADPDLPWAGPDPAAWARRIGVERDTTARELVVAAVREVFEECGVLLAGPDGDSLVADLGAAEWDTERERLLSREQSFAQLLIRRGLVLRSDLLSARGHWTTPECEPRRYDTRFFAARMPAGQVADDRTSEAVRADWVRADELLAEYAAERNLMLPPTVVSVEQLAAASSADEFLAEEVDVVPIMPEPAEHSGRIWMRAPLPR